MEIIEWIVWCLACGWAVLMAFYLLKEAFEPRPPVPMFGVYLSVFQQWLVNCVYFASLTVALVATVLWDISKLHLLWFVPLFHLFGLQHWITSFFTWRNQRRLLNKRAGEICKEMQKDGWDISKDTFKKDINIRPVRREFFKRIEADTNKMLEQLKTRVQKNENESQKHSK